MSDPRQPRPDDVVLGGQFQAPVDGLVLGGLEGVKQRFETGNIEAKKAALEQALNYGDKGLAFLGAISGRELPDEIRRYAKRLHVLELLKRSDSKSLKGMDLRGVDLTKAKLFGVDLSGANLYGADLSQANLHAADLRGACLRAVNLTNVEINASTQINEKWRLVWEIVNYGGSNRNLSGANLYGANLQGIDLNNANLSWANLCETDLKGANLRAANLSWANLYGANLSGAQVDEFTVIDAQWKSASWWNLLEWDKKQDNNDNWDDAYDDDWDETYYDDDLDIGLFPDSDD